MMLDAGAETDVVNSVGRTAAQMAAFVGMSGYDVQSFALESSLLNDAQKRDHTPHFAFNSGHLIGVNNDCGSQHYS